MTQTQSSSCPVLTAQPWLQVLQLQATTQRLQDEADKAHRHLGSVYLMVKRWQELAVQERRERQGLLNTLEELKVPAGCPRLRVMPSRLLREYSEAPAAQAAGCGCGASLTPTQPLHSACAAASAAGQAAAGLWCAGPGSRPRGAGARRAGQPNAPGLVLPPGPRPWPRPA